MAVKWGVMGTANVAAWGTIPGILRSSNSELYAIAGRSLQKAQDYKERFGFRIAYGSYEGLLQDPEVQAVYIPLPNHLHLPWVKKAMQAGKHVLCEKPLALNASEAEEMYKTAEECGVILMEAYAYLHSPYIESLKKDIDSGIIGDVDYIDTAFVTQGYKEDIRLYKEMGGGALYDLGCYCTTMILSLTGSKPEYVDACSELSDKGIDLNTSCIMRFENGARASFSVGMILGNNTNSRYDRLYIHGSKGSIISDVEYNGQGDLSYKIMTGGEVITREISVPQNYSLEFNNMSASIEGTGKPLITPQFSIDNARLIDTIMQKAGIV